MASSRSLTLCLQLPFESVVQFVSEMSKLVDNQMSDGELQRLVGRTQFSRHRSATEGQRPAVRPF